MDKFRDHVCVGDSINWDVIDSETGKVFTLSAVVEHDSDTDVEDFDCYDDDDIQAFNDNWYFCGVVISVSVDGVELSSHAASVWGVEVNITDNNDYLTDLAKEMESEAVAVAKAVLAKLQIVKAATVQEYQRA